MLSWKVVFHNKICTSTFATAIEISQYNIVTHVIDCTTIQNLTIENTNNLFGLHEHVHIVCIYQERKIRACTYRHIVIHKERMLLFSVGYRNEMAKFILSLELQNIQNNNWNLHYI